MKFRNPWVDPRVEQVRPEAVEAYLDRNGWKRVGPASNPHLLRYEMEGREDAPTLFVPLRIDEGPGLQWLIELVGDLARFEDRWAVEVLGEILAPGTGGAATANGAVGGTGARPVSSEGA
jgi:hypothetical protein